MRYARIVVFSALALVATPTLAQRLPSGTVPVEAVRGAGFLQALACGACIGSGAALLASGWGAVWIAAMRAGDGALAGACIEACSAG